MMMHKVIYMKPGSGFILENRTNYSVEDLTPRQDIQETPRHAENQGWYRPPD
jgi:hypothetical protein